MESYTQQNPHRLVFFVNFFSRAVLLNKLGVDLQAIFSDIQGGQFSVIRIPLLSFAGSQGVNSAGSVVRYVEFDPEWIARDYPTVVWLVRTLLLGVLFLTLIRLVMVTLRQY